MFGIAGARLSVSLQFSRNEISLAKPSTKSNIVFAAYKYYLADTGRS
jgi:hypothetical protein